MLAAVAAVLAIVCANVATLVLVRSVMSLINAQKHQPMPNPDSWLI